MSSPSDVWQVERRAIPVSHLEKSFWPEAGFTKRDMLRYYLRIAPVADDATEGKVQERLVPFVDQFVKTVDLAGKKITLDWGLDY